MRGGECHSSSTTNSEQSQSNSGVENAIMYKLCSFTLLQCCCFLGGLPIELNIGEQTTNTSMLKVDGINITRINAPAHHFVE